MKKLLALSIALLVMVGCSSSRAMVEQRHKEIDEAFARGDITEIQRQELKNEALKAIRAGGK